MRPKLLLHFLAFLVCAAFVAGCVSEHVQRQTGESVILVGEQPAALAHLPIPGKPVSVRNTYLPEQRTIEYVEGKDFVMDTAAGTIHRSSNSRLTDFRNNMLYGRENFDHTQFPGFGNAAYFAFIDYSFAAKDHWPVQPRQTRFLKATQTKLKSGQSLKLVAFGDSIAAGGDASRPELIFWRRWADALQRKYPTAQITVINGATGGDSTIQGLQRLREKVLYQKPDLVLIGFGMNDHNINGVPVPQFECNLKEMITRIRAETSAEIVLFSAFPPNPKWKFGSHRMSEYAAATARVAQAEACAYADVFTNWQTIAARKKPEDMLGNNINHPNDFGHWIYFRVLQELGL